jgi:chromosome segregation ATPase
MPDEAYVVKILMLRDELLRLKAIYRRKDAELTKLKPLLGAFKREREDHHRTLQELYAVQDNLHEQTARTIELRHINRQLWSHVERFHTEAQEKNQLLTKTDNDLMHLQQLFRMRGKDITRLQKRIIELCSNEGKLKHQLKEKSEIAEKRRRRFYEFNQQLAKLQNQFVEKQREANEKGKLVRRTEKVLAGRQNWLMKKEREADEKNELVRRTEEMIAELRTKLEEEEREADERHRPRSNTDRDQLPKLHPLIRNVWTYWFGDQWDISSNDLTQGDDRSRSGDDVDILFHGKVFLLPSLGRSSAALKVLWIFSGWQKHSDETGMADQEADWARHQIQRDIRQPTGPILVS